MNEIIFWLSWHQPTDDFRPLTDPPTEPILGWWCTGYDAENVPILCGAVLAKSEREAKRLVRKDWPEADQWRFCEPCTSDWSLSDRFPLNDWMKKRFARLSSWTKGQA